MKTDQDSISWTAEPAGQKTNYGGKVLRFIILLMMREESRATTCSTSSRDRYPEEGRDEGAMEEEEGATGPRISCRPAGRTERARDEVERCTVGRRSGIRSRGGHTQKVEKAYNPIVVCLKIGESEVCFSRDLERISSNWQRKIHKTKIGM
ncbi:hypothetical protein H6P81_017584 [Aristolochia fimbriata]|uniref:Uncharacterized protein n=1 Tax=Aristolochia fimbriata TaxID=158543 RepID=A0AAV7E0K1_ARIFI|nr:hypothetical protein H6P81_017584 [Aristolochia fimbriata]